MIVMVMVEHLRIIVIVMNVVLIVVVIFQNINLFRR